MGGHETILDRNADLADLFYRIAVVDVRKVYADDASLGGRGRELNVSSHNLISNQVRTGFQEQWKPKNSSEH